MSVFLSFCLSVYLSVCLCLTLSLSHSSSPFPHPSLLPGPLFPPPQSEWCQLSSPRVGLFFFNKFTGETRRGTAATSGQPEIDLLNQAYRQVEEVTFELEQYKQENRELQNQLAQAREEQEVLAAQLDETGHTLDEANSEIRHKEGEMVELRAIITGREQQVEELQSQSEFMCRAREREGGGLTCPSCLSFPDLFLPLFPRVYRLLLHSPPLPPPPPLTLSPSPSPTVADMEQLKGTLQHLEQELHDAQ